MSSTALLSSPTRPLPWLWFTAGIVVTLIVMIAADILVNERIMAPYMGRRLSDAEITQAIHLTGMVHQFMFSIADTVISALLFFRLAPLFPSNLTGRLMAVIGLAVGLPVLLTTLFHWNLIIVAVVQGVLAIGLGLFAGVAKSTHRSRQAPSNTAGDHRPPSALNRFVGTARNVRRTDLQPSSTSLAFVQGGQSLRRTMLSFRLEVTDEQGDIGFYRQVELVGDVIHGDIADGDQVEISSWTERQGVLAVTRVRNLSLNGDVSVEQNTGIQWFSRARLAVGVVGFIAFACFFYFVSSQLTSMKPPPGFGMPPVTTPPGVTTLPGAMNNAINHPNLPPPVVHR